MKRDNRIKKYINVVSETYKYIGFIIKLEPMKVIFLLQKVKYYKTRICCLIEKNISERNKLIEVFD